MCEKEQCVLELLNRCKIYSHGSIPHSLKVFVQIDFFVIKDKKTTKIFSTFSRRQLPIEGHVI